MQNFTDSSRLFSCFSHKARSERLRTPKASQPHTRPPGTAWLTFRVVTPPPVSGSVTKAPLACSPSHHRGSVFTPAVQSQTLSSSIEAKGDAETHSSGTMSDQSDAMKQFDELQVRADPTAQREGRSREPSLVWTNPIGTSQISRFQSAHTRSFLFTFA